MLMEEPGTLLQRHIPRRNPTHASYLDWQIWVSASLESRRWPSAFGQLRPFGIADPGTFERPLRITCRPSPSGPLGDAQTAISPIAVGIGCNSANRKPRGYRRRYVPASTDESAEYNDARERPLLSSFGPSMTPESTCRRNFVKWLVSSFCLTLP